MSLRARVYYMLALFAVIGAANCATARPDPAKLQDSLVVHNEFASMHSPLRIEVIEANLHADLGFYPDRRGLYYRIFHDEVLVLNWSPLGLETDSQSFVSDLKTCDVQISTVMHEYDLAHGKVSHVKKMADRFLLAVENSLGQKLTIEFVLQRDAVAFRYLVPGNGKVTIRRELTGFRLPLNSTGVMQQYQEASKVSPAYEYYYEKVKAGETDDGKASIRKIFQPLVGFTGLVIFGSDGWAMPALFETPEKKSLLITEAGVDANHAAMHLTAKPSHNLYTLEWPAEKEGNGVGSVLPQGSLPYKTPYRTLMCCDLKTIFESTAMTDLAAPLDKKFGGKLPAWVKPGKATWDWLSYVATGDAARQKEYIDAASQFGWQYTLIDANWNKWNNNNAEPLIKELVAYARERNVGLWLWYNSGGPTNSVTEEPRDAISERETRRREFARLQKLGIKGVKIDFWQSDKQSMLQQYLDTLADAADYQLMVNFHGSTMPKGWQRRFPNLMTMEAVKGAEWYQFPVFRGPTAQDNVYYAFTRNVIGPMDYTPLVFEQAFKQQKITYAHSLALSVIFESGVQHFADNADDAKKGFRKLTRAYPFVGSFLRDVPAAWQETLLLEGNADSHIVVARFYEGVWYVAGINASTKEIHIRQPFTFGIYGKYRAEWISEDDSGDTLRHAETQLHTGRSQFIETVIRPRGGFVLKLTPL